MRIVINDASTVPIYQQIVDRISTDIRGGVLPAGYKLPTVRNLSEMTGASRGTIKHAYDALEQLGLIDKTQGRGTFVCQQGPEQSSSAKEQALESIDRLLDQMQELNFSMKDIRIIIELKLREREQMVQNVRIGAVDCSPEALSVMRLQLAALPHVDVYEYLLDTVLDNPQRFDPGLDLYITTPTHYDELAAKMPPVSRLIRMVMAVSRTSVLEMARVPATAKVGILCASHRFGDIMARACDKYCLLQSPPQTASFGDENLEEFMAGVDQLILPPNYLQFCSPQDQAILLEHGKTTPPPIIYQYKLEQSSLLYLEEQIGKIYRTNKETI